MTTDPPAAPPRSSAWQAFARKDVLAGLLFIAVGTLGLWLSRDYPVGTAFRMGTGYMPRLLCWILLGLGAIVLVLGLRDGQVHGLRDGHAAPAGSAAGIPAWRPVLFVTAGLVVFGLAIERLGLVLAVFLLVGLAAVAGRGLRPIETVVAALVLIALCWAIFILALGLTIQVWPEW
jgi:hypothetical protein